MVNPNEKEKFLEQLREIPNVSVVCKRTGISKASIYRWIKEDEKFQEQFTEALSKGKESITDLAEGQVIQLIKKGNLNAIKLWLENNTNTYRKPKKPFSPEQVFVPVKSIVHKLWRDRDGVDVNLYHDSKGNYVDHYGDPLPPPPTNREDPNDLDTSLEDQ